MSLRSLWFLKSAVCLLALFSLTSVGWGAPQSTPAADTESNGAIIPANSAAISAAIDKARAFAYQNTHAPIGPLGKLAASQLQVFGTAMGIPAEQLQNAKVADYGTFVMAVTENWIYTADVAGNQTLRPISNLPYILQGLDHPASISEADSNAGRITSEARNITSLLGLKANLKSAICKKEQLIVGKCGAGNQIQLYDGRYFVRICDDDGTFLHLICDAECKPIRVDTNIQTETTATLSKMLYQQLKQAGTVPLLNDGTEDITFGTFFSSHEARFETNAISFEGRQLPSVTSGGNPYDNATDGNDWWGFTHWDRNGRVDGIRGNWDEDKGAWQKPSVTVVHHAMENYTMVGKVNLDSNTIDTSFHRDLEDCTVGVFLTHGGPINNNYQIEGKTWFVPGDSQSKYGTGNLRHLIFDTCGAMGFISEQGGGGYKSLLGEWMPGKYVDGLRTACGNDGGSAELDRDGWRFFCLYNKGDSIETSWAYASIVECAQNMPATIAYAGTLEEAVIILADGRFSKDRSTPVYSVASVWKEIK